MQMNMNLYDLTKQYGEGKGESMMWTTLSIVSQAIDDSMEQEAREHLLRKLYGKMSNGHYNKEYAHEDVAKMYYFNDSGDQEAAPYWTEPQVKNVYDSVASAIPGEYNFWDFYVTLQMSRADNYNILKLWYPDVTSQEKDEKYVELAVNWLNDPDNPYGNSKIWKYLNPGM